MTECPCAECATHKPAPVTSMRRIRSAIGSAMLREIERLERALAELQLKPARPHFVDLICDRCRSSTISITSTSALPDPATGAMLERLAFEAGWRLGGGHVCPACVVT